MKKKIFKYIKVVMACLLITSLTLPSYAAVSASDGSAFVTKAEFDAALSDFNARLTTFEAGINSKIDSQVSSYLDRNGIWNGKAQTLLNSDFTFTDEPEYALYISEYKANLESVSYIIGSGYSDGECVKSPTSKTANVLKFDGASYDDLNKTRSVFKANKSGMCVVNVTHRFFGNYSDSDGRTIYNGWPKQLGFGRGETSGTWSNFIDNTKCAGDMSGLMFATGQDYVMQGMISPFFTCSANWQRHSDGKILFTSNLIQTGVGMSPYKGKNGLSHSIPFKTEKLILFYFVKNNELYDLNVSLACGGKFWESAYLKGGSKTNPFLFSFYGVESIDIY